MPFSFEFIEAASAWHAFSLATFFPSNQISLPWPTQLQLQPWHGKTAKASQYGDGDGGDMQVVPWFAGVAAQLPAVGVVTPLHARMFVVGYLGTQI